MPTRAGRRLPALLVVAALPACSAPAPEASPSPAGSPAAGGGAGTGASMRARHTNDLTLPSGQVLRASGREVAVDGVSVLRVRSGKIVEFRRFSDRLGLLAQLGLLPT